MVWLVVCSCSVSGCLVWLCCVNSVAVVCFFCVCGLFVVLACLSVMSDYCGFFYCVFVCVVWVFVFCLWFVDLGCLLDNTLVVWFLVRLLVDCYGYLWLLAGCVRLVALLLG